MNSIANNIKKYIENIPSSVKLVAVSKTQSTDKILQAYEVGQKVFGENKVQELIQKHEELPKDIQWHYIGHLQTNKVKYIAPFISLIHSVDSLKLLKEINNEAIKSNRTIDCLLQLYIANEETKFGLSEQEIEDILKSEPFKNLTNIRIIGLMGMATFTENGNQIKNEFSYLAKVFEKIKTTYFNDKNYFTELSMGMSGDYQIAIECGSTMIRIGTDIFGNRN
ncbi:MAG TPA: YggS family pyridoxal phosphate-dependent enzyme [Bacteroidales bacterium]|nr:MAG: YggS family pyridoxal phosphate enzyme [Bacteroidetes bacterium GWF2_33_38]HBF88787.1 YggS family pyridoxal phosphate-dependent enzyme [Bacteroidales bacterium]